MNLRKSSKNYIRTVQQNIEIAYYTVLISYISHLD